MTTVTQAELARNLGVSRSYVTALKAADRLVISDDGSGIELEASLARIDATRDPQRVDVSERHASARAGTLLKASQANPEENKPPPAPPADRGDPNSYQAARAIKEIYAAKTARMEYERSIGQLLDRQAVENAVEDTMTVVRQHLEQMPNRLSPQIIGQPLDAVRATIKREVNATLTEMVREFKARLQELTP
jgi:hypothetical protein